MHRVDGRSYWFAGYFSPFDLQLMTRYAGAARAARDAETFDGRLPFAGARIVRVFDPDPVAAEQFSRTFDVPTAESLDAFAAGLDGVIVPFPAGGEARDYNAASPLVERGIPLFLDRIILEQSERLRAMCIAAQAQRVPLHIASFIRYLAPQLLPKGVDHAEGVVASAAGDPAGYGADLLGLIDQLMVGRAKSVTNIGDETGDVLRIAYDDGRHAELRLARDGKAPMHVTATGDGWHRDLELDGSHNHVGAMWQFEAFLESLDTRRPPVPYWRVLNNAAILHAAERRAFGQPISLGGANAGLEG